MRITIGILSYNMPHLTDALYAELRQLVKVESTFVILDNGSDADKIAKATTHRFDDNKRLTGGMNRILDIAKGSDYVWLCTNDITFTTSADPVASMLAKTGESQQIGVIHPALQEEPVKGYAYQYMINNGKQGVYAGYPMVDIICPMYTKKAMEANEWQFDSRFEYGWGIDYDSCWKARQAGLRIAVDHDTRITHQTSITYDSGKDREFKNRNEYYDKAFKNMNAVMESKYGTNWRNIFI